MRTFRILTNSRHFILGLALFVQLENIGNFVRAIQEYGLRPNDIFEANDLFENANHTQVQCTLITLAGTVSHTSCMLIQKSGLSQDWRLRTSVIFLLFISKVHSKEIHMGAFNC